MVTGLNLAVTIFYSRKRICLPLNLLNRFWRMIQLIIFHLAVADFNNVVGHWLDHAIVGDNDNILIGFIAEILK